MLGRLTPPRPPLFGGHRLASPVRVLAASTTVSRVAGVGIPPFPELNIVVGAVSSPFIVIYKPSGLPLFDVRGRDSVLSRLGALGAGRFSGQEPAHCVHRLDKHTEGLTVVSLTASARRKLALSISRGCWTKRYRALTHLPPCCGEGTVRPGDCRVQEGGGSDTFALSSRADRPYGTAGLASDAPCCLASPWLAGSLFGLVEHGSLARATAITSVEPMVSGLPWLSRPRRADGTLWWGTGIAGKELVRQSLWAGTVGRMARLAHDPGRGGARGAVSDESMQYGLEHDAAASRSRLTVQGRARLAALRDRAGWARLAASPQPAPTTLTSVSTYRAPYCGTVDLASALRPRCAPWEYRLWIQSGLIVPPGVVPRCASDTSHGSGQVLPSPVAKPVHRVTPSTSRPARVVLVRLLNALVPGIPHYWPDRSPYPRDVGFPSICPTPALAHHIEAPLARRWALAATRRGTCKWVRDQMAILRQRRGGGASRVGALAEHEAALLPARPVPACHPWLLETVLNMSVPPGTAFGARAAVTRVTLVRRAVACAVWAVELVTGRTHQIRVHLAEAGCPIVGDPYYNTWCVLRHLTLPHPSGCSGRGGGRDRRGSNGRSSVAERWAWPAAARVPGALTPVATLDPWPATLGRLTGAAGVGTPEDPPLVRARKQALYDSQHHPGSRRFWPGGGLCLRTGWLGDLAGGTVDDPSRPWCRPGGPPKPPSPAAPPSSYSPSLSDRVASTPPDLAPGRWSTPEYSAWAAEQAATRGWSPELLTDEGDQPAWVRERVRVERRVGQLVMAGSSSPPIGGHHSSHTADCRLTWHHVHPSERTSCSAMGLQACSLAFPNPVPRPDRAAAKVPLEDRVSVSVPEPTWWCTLVPDHPTPQKTASPTFGLGSDGVTLPSMPEPT